MGKVLTKADILGAQDLKVERVSVPEWGGDVFLRSMSSRERDNLEAEAVGWGKGTRAPNFRARLIAQLACDEGGNALFTVADVDALGKKSGAASSRLFNKIMEMTNFTAADIEDLEKN